MSKFTKEQLEVIREFSGVYSNFIPQFYNGEATPDGLFFAEICLKNKELIMNMKKSLTLEINESDYPKYEENKLNDKYVDYLEGRLNYAVEVKLPFIASQRIKEMLIDIAYLDESEIEKAEAAKERCCKSIKEMGKYYKKNLKERKNEAIKSIIFNKKEKTDFLNRTAAIIESKHDEFCKKLEPIALSKVEEVYNAFFANRDMVKSVKTIEQDEMEVKIRDLIKQFNDKQPLDEKGQRISLDLIKK